MKFYRQLLLLAILLVVSLMGMGMMIKGPKQSTVMFENGPTVSVEIADSLDEQSKGLAGHHPLDDAHGMLFVFSGSEERSFWMKGMTFPIDLMWLNDGKVIGFQKKMAPQNADELLLTYVSPGPADMVLEVAAGWVERNRIQIGQAVSISNP